MTRSNPFSLLDSIRYDYLLLIFNRWGEIVFESHNALVGWNGEYAGQVVHNGVYVWKIEFSSKGKDDRSTITGHVTGS